MPQAHDSESLIAVRHDTLECVERLLATVRDLDSSIARARVRLAHSRESLHQAVHLVYSWKPLRSRERVPVRRDGNGRAARGPAVHARVA